MRNGCQCHFLANWPTRRRKGQTTVVSGVLVLPRSGGSQGIVSVVLQVVAGHLLSSMALVPEKGRHRQWGQHWTTPKKQWGHSLSHCPLCVTLDTSSVQRSSSVLLLLLSLLFLRCSSRRKTDWVLEKSKWKWPQWTVALEDGGGRRTMLVHCCDDWPRFWPGSSWWRRSVRPPVCWRCTVAPDWASLLAVG